MTFAEARSSITPVDADAARAARERQGQLTKPPGSLGLLEDLGVQLAERSVGRERHLHEITNAAHVDEHLVRPFSSEASAKLTNHRQSVLPPFLRLSTQSGVAGVA